jgi:hypothetical protein
MVSRGKDTPGRAAFWTMQSVIEEFGTVANLSLCGRWFPTIARFA